MPKTSVKQKLNHEEHTKRHEKIRQIRDEVGLILESRESNQLKYTQLKQIEKEQYKPLIQELASQNTSEGIMALVIVLNDLGCLTTKLGDLSGTNIGEPNEKLRYYTNAAVFYQYVITILDKKLNEESITPEKKERFITQQHIDPQEKLSHLQQLIFSAIGGAKEKMPDIQKEAANNKQILLTLREKADKKLQEVENYRQQPKINDQEEKQKYQELYVKTAQALFEDIASEMKNFLARLYSDSEQQMSIDSPNGYAVVGLGSMALQQMTPYSDLEFAILTENEDYKKSDDPRVRGYFKNLSHLVNFKVINLGESIIPYSKYQLDMDHLVRVAVNLDLGGKTPLGRIEGDKQYELIKTVDGMMHYMRNEGDRISHIDKNLPYILENVCYVYGKEKLVQDYKGKVSDFLHAPSDPNNLSGPKNCEIRAIKLLKEGAVEIDYVKSDHNSRETNLKGDLEKLDPKLSFDTAGKLFNVKQEIYRLPDRLVYNLGLYYGSEGDSSWDTVDKLKSQNILTPEAALNLKNAVTFATTLRLKTYLHYESQTEDMSIFIKPVETEAEIKEQVKQMFHLSEEHLGEEGSLFHYFYTALPLHNRLKDFCEQHETLDGKSKQNFFLVENFYNNSFANKGYIYWRLAQYHQAQGKLEQALKEPENKGNWKLQGDLGIIYFTIGDYVKAIRLSKDCLAKYKSIKKDKPHLGVISSLNNLGLAYDSKGQHNQAIKLFKRGLKVTKQLYNDQPHLKVASFLNNLGNAYDNKGQYEPAIKYHEESLKMRELIHNEQPHLDVVQSLNNLGSAYNKKGRYDQAIKYHEKSLKMNYLIHKKQPHPDVASSLNNLGTTYGDKEQYDQMINYLNESLKMKKLIYNKPHPNVAISLNNLGTAYRYKGQYDQAIKYCEKSLAMYKLIHEEQPHQDVAGTLNNLGQLYYDKKQYYQAIKRYKKSLHMNYLIYKKQPFSGVAVTLNNLGKVYRQKRQYKKAIKYQEKSLKMNYLIHKKQPHPDVASSLTDLGNSYICNEQDDKAIKCHKKSLMVNKIIHKKQPHPDVANSLINLGFAYNCKGQDDQAIKYFEKSLEMRKLIHKRQPHPDVASSLNTLGNAYRDKGQYEKAIKCHKKSLQMYYLIHKKQPHADVASSFTNLGNSYLCKEQDDQAIKCHKKSLQMYYLIQK